MLRSMRDLLSTSHMVDLYNALLLPRFDYCCELWGNCGEVLKIKLQKLQNGAARIITRVGYEVRSTEIRDNPGWTDLETRRKRRKCKIMKGAAPSSLRGIFTRVNTTSDYNLRW